MRDETSGAMRADLEPVTAQSTRGIARIGVIPLSRMDARLSSREVHQALAEAELDPFLVVSLFEMSGPVFPPHPHAGFTVATYILPESPAGFINQDSLGTRNEIQPGGLHATVAGSGVLHEEQPVRTGTAVRGYQIWIDHRNGARALPPRPVTLEAADVPQYGDDGVRVRVLIGGSHGIESPVQLPTPIRLLDVTLAPGAHWHERVMPAERGFVVVVSGAMEVGGQVVSADHVATLGHAGELLTCQAGSGGARFTVFLGEPLAQPRVFGGPVVGGTRQEVEAFLQAATRGEFGRLAPFSS